MADQDDLRFSASQEEILGKIELAHERGEHTLGPIAGCAICASSLAAGTPGHGARLNEDRDPAALLSQLAANTSAAAAPRGRIATVPLHPKRPESIEEGPETDEPEPGIDTGTKFSNMALDELEKAPVMPAQRAQVYALVALERQLARIAALLGDVAEEWLDTPEPDARLAAVTALEPVDRLTASEALADDMRQTIERQLAGETPTPLETRAPGPDEPPDAA